MKLEERRHFRREKSRLLQKSCRRLEPLHVQARRERGGFCSQCNQRQDLHRHVGSRIEPYAAGKLGLVFIDNKEFNARDYTYFTVGVDLGCRLYLTEKFGLSAASQLMMPVQGLGGAIFVGSGGAGVGVNGYSSIAQFCFNIGGFFQL